MTETSESKPKDTLHDMAVISGNIGEFLQKHFTYVLPNPDQPVHDRFKVRWSKNMPEDGDPDHEILIEDADGQEYIVDVEVMLNPTSPEQRAKDMAFLREHMEKLGLNTDGTALLSETGEAALGNPAGLESEDRA